MVVTATEYKANFVKYLTLITKEDVFIPRNGQPWNVRILFTNPPKSYILSEN